MEMQFFDRFAMFPAAKWQISASPDLLEGMKLEELVTSEFLVRLT